MIQISHAFSTYKHQILNRLYTPKGNLTAIDLGSTLEVTHEPD